MNGETLELRLALDSGGALPAIDPDLTLSFVPDGTDVAGETSTLMARFDSITASSQWQTAIVKAFQTWATHTDANVGVVADQGDDLGTPGNTADDKRFGDIRIAARALDPSVAAISIPLTSPASGSWVGDVVFNSNFDFETVDDIFAVALHEAGNVFGLADSTDPNSPLFPGGIPTATWPTSDDIRALRELHGVRSVDFHEVDIDGESPRQDNNAFVDATPIRFPELHDVEGAAPAILYGDLQDTSDLDFFFLETPGDYSGSLTVELRTARFSALTPTLAVYNESLQLIDEAELPSPLSGGQLTVHVAGVSSDDKLYIRVGSNSPDVLGIGAYSLVAILDAFNQLPAHEIDALSNGQYSRLHPEELVKLYATDDSFVSEEENADDDLDSATELSSDVSFASGTRFQILGSISTSVDKDVFKVATPADSTLSTMTVSVRSLNPGQLVPDVTIYDDDGNEVTSQVVGHGGGVVRIQAHGIRGDKEYFVAVSAASDWLFQTGNYELSIEFSANAVILQAMASGSVDAAQNHSEHTLYIARPQLFHFVLEVTSGETAVPAAVHIQLNNVGDAEVDSIFDLTISPGRSRSGPSVLLLPGSYTLTADAITANGQLAAEELTYVLRGTPVSDPLAIELDDGLEAPFDCPPPNGDQAFCYPDGTTTSQPFNWDEFVQRLFASQQLQGERLNAVLFGDWWSWYWATGGAGESPVNSADSFQLNSNVTLDADGDNGLLSNDTDPEGQPLLAVVDMPPVHGDLELSADGSFAYTPLAGFIGLDQFTYRAFDFGSLSEPATVSIEVFEIADFDYNGHIDSQDIDALANAIAEGSNNARFDINSDQHIDLQDHTFLISEILVVFPGDANLDGTVDAVDLAFWKNHNFSMSVGWGQGDFNADRVTDVRDFNLWSQHKFQENSPAAIPALARIPEAPLAASILEVSAVEHAFGDRRFLAQRVSTMTRRHRNPIVRSFVVSSQWVSPAGSSELTGEPSVPRSQERSDGKTIETTNTFGDESLRSHLPAGLTAGMHNVYFVARAARNRN